MTTINMHIKFEIEIPKQTWLTLRKPCCLPSQETKRSNMAARRPFWTWRRWKSIDSYPYTFCYWSLELIFKANLKLESGNQKIQYGRQAAILKVRSLKINRLLPMTTINMHMKSQIEIPKQTSKANLCSGNHVVYRQTDKRMDRRTRWILYTPPPTSLGGGIKIVWKRFRVTVQYNQREHLKDCMWCLKICKREW